MLVFVFIFFRKIIFVSRASLESFPAYFKILGNKKLCVVRNGVNIDRIDSIIEKGQKNSAENTFKIVSVGRLIEQKRPLSLLEVFYRINDGQSALLFIGDGPLRDSIVGESKRLGVENNVNLLKKIPREDVYRYLLHSDLFVSMSVVEGLPVAVLEAMACGCPIILSAIPPHEEISEGIDFILLVSPDNIDGFAREIRRIRHISHSQRLEVGEKCRKLVEDRFSLRAMHEGYEELYKEVLEL